MLHANNDSEGQLELWVDKFYITSPPLTPPKNNLTSVIKWQKQKVYLSDFFY